MGIKAACPCGAQFMAKPELAGRNVQCPTCGQTFQVPVAAPQQPKTFQVACACGRSYQVQPAMAGRPVRCQACGQQFAVPQPPGAGPQTPAAPTAQPSDPLADPLGDLGDLSSFGDPLGGTLPAAGSPSHSLPTMYAPAGGVARPKTKRKSVNSSTVIDMMKYFAEKGEEMREQMGGSQRMTMMNASQELKDVVIDGDSARGMQTVSLMGNTVEVPIEFRKVDGGWLIHQPTFQEAANRPPADNDPFGGPGRGGDAEASGEYSGYSISISWVAFKGVGTPEIAARKALADLPGLVPGTVEIDARSQQIKLRASNSNMDAVKQRLNAAGFNTDPESFR